MVNPSKEDVVKKISLNRSETASAMLVIARQIISEDEQEGQDDPKMTEKLRNLRSQLTKLNSKRNKTLKQMGVSFPIKPTTKVEDLVDLLIGMTTM